VKFKDNAGQDKRAEMMAKHSLKEKSEIKGIGIKILTVPQGKDPLEVAKLLNKKEQDNILFAEPDYKYELSAIPNDPIYPSEWHLPRIQAPEAWDLTAGSSNVIIAILDSGLESSHPDIQSKVVPGWNTYDNNSNTSPISDHGTRTAGAAAAVSNNSVGVSSVCWGCSIMPIRVTDASGMGYSSTISAGLAWAASQGARIASASFNGLFTSSTIRLAAETFMTENNGVFFAPSGNTGAELTAPEYASPYMIVVGSSAFSTAGDVLASFSTRGVMLDLAAPATSIYTTDLGGQYLSVSGASYASPIAAGVAGLILSADLNLQATEVRDIMVASVDDAGSEGWDSSWGWGRVNALKAVQTALGELPPPADDTVPPTVPTLSAVAPDSATVNLTWAASSDNSGVSSYRVYRDNVFYAVVSSTNYSNTSVVAGETYAYAVTAVDIYGNESAKSNTVSVTVPVDVLPSPSEGAPSVPANLSAIAPDNTKVNLAWNASTDDVEVMGYKIYRDGSYLTQTRYISYVNTGVTAGRTYSYAVSAFDSAGNESAKSNTVSVTVPAEAAPADTVSPSAPANLSATAPDSSEVNLAWNASTDNVGVAGYKIYRDGSYLAQTANVTNYTNTGVTAGRTYSYAVSAFDSAGNESAKSAEVSINVPLSLLSVLNYSVPSKTSSTATINWETSVPSTGVIYYGTAKSDLNLNAVDLTFASSHSVILTGLKSNTNYYYKIWATTDTESVITKLSSFRTSK